MPRDPGSIPSVCNLFGSAFLLFFMSACYPQDCVWLLFFWSVLCPHVTPSGYPPTAIGYPPTAIGYPPTAIGYPPTAIGYPPTAVGYPPTAIGYPPTAVGYPPTAIVGRIGHSEFFFSLRHPLQKHSPLLHIGLGFHSDANHSHDQPNLVMLQTRQHDTSRNK